MALSFTEVALDQINATFEHIFAEERSKIGANLLPVVQSNLLLPYRERQCDLALQKLLDTLSLVHPGRFFLVREESNGLGIRAAVSATCHIIAARQYFCSEVIELRVGTANLAAVPSVIRAHAATGVPLELLVCATAAGTASLERLLPLADRVLLDSGELKDERLIAALTGRGKDIFDFEWLRLLPWRRLLKEVFDQPEMFALLPTLTEIRLSSTGDKSAKLYQPALLMGGWLLHCLRLDAAAGEGRQVRWRSPQGRTGHLLLEHQPGERVLRSVELQFESPDAAVCLTLQGDGRIAATAGGRELTSVTVEEQTMADLARLYYEDALADVTYNKTLRKVALLHQVEGAE